ncbi:MAG TPA: aminotransferase class III-fold pyridoxal phosphate-dependent enzyme, partial [Thermoanaerobaculia bacterium]|nr:aminotransferase class III-fold pyridoxal phosphate-dependent enzyme [Thermoanaerobaculia bacterium]
MSPSSSSSLAGAVAVIGMAGRFPGASSVAELWRNLCGGVESISFFTAEELEAAGVPRKLLRQPGYVGAKGIVDDVERFDHEFFGLSARLAQVMDPQQRLFLECSWEALEDAGYDPEVYPGAIGVYAGSAPSSYLMLHVMPNLAQVAALGELQITTGNDKDYLPTQVSYKLNLRGPSLAVQTACSSSLVAVHLACQSLLGSECDMALAGGVSIKFPNRAGYVYQEGGILSPDGHCRPFDALAQGTVSSAGLGLVVLKRYEDAVADGDSIRAVILGSAINNDGSRKIGYTAPSLDGQAKVIAEALAVAGVDPATIGYIEAHGTATAVGDPIEVAALQRAFAAAGRGELCALGSIKGNLGHLDTAAGVAGLIKAVLALQYGQLPPSLHYQRPNPALDLGDGPFFVNTQLREWRPAAGLRRAGVSSFGVGGTNAHVVLEEPPPRPVQPSLCPWHLLVVSARSAAALDSACLRLAEHLRHRPDLDLADVAFTLQAGRKAFDYRRFVVCRDLAEALSALSALAAPGGTRTRHERRRGRPVVFLFPGQGAQYPGMASELYAEEPVFRAEIDRACDLLVGLMGIDLRRLLFPPPGEEAQAAGRLAETLIAQPALFVVEHALARLWMALGVTPQAMIGHSLGEIVAACLSGVFRLQDALTLVAARGRLMQSLPRGAMLGVALPAGEIEPLLDARCALAAVNAADRCVVAGDEAAVAELERELAVRGTSCRRLDTSHAFHSPMMEPVQPAIAELVSGLTLGAPKIPWISNVTGTWITPQEACDPGYWAAHVRERVRFADGLGVLLQEERALIEVGPGKTLTSLACRIAGGRDVPMVTSLPEAGSSRPQLAGLLDGLAALWLSGVDIDWRTFHRAAPRRRVPLPTYPFERQRVWLEPARAPQAPVAMEEIRVSEVEALPATVAIPVTARRGRILSILGEIVSDLLGIPVARIDADLPFLDVGVDSLMLIQASQAIHKRFGVKLTLAELLEQHTTLAAVATALDRELPAAAFAEEPLAPRPAASPQPAVANPDPAVAAGASPATALQQIVSEQLQLMARQIELLRGAGVVSSAIPAPAGPPVPESSPPPASPPVAPFVHPFAAGPVLAESEELSSRQRQHLAALVARYCSRTAESKRRTQANRAHLAENRASVGFRMRWKEMVYPLIVERSAGSRIWDVDGNEYVDLAMGFSVHLFGHSPEFVATAIEEQMRKGIHLGPQSDLAGEVARLIGEMTGMDRVTFTNSGTEAVMTALRLARAVTGRDRIALFSGSYHGSFDGVLARQWANAGRQRAAASSPGVPRGMVDDVLVLDYGAPAALEALRAAGSDLAAVLVEPVQSRRPSLQPRDFLHQLRRLTEENGAALIFDEVVTGFRVHPGGAQAWFDVRADLSTYGKVVGGGMPIGILAGRPRFMDAIDGGPWSFGDDSYPRTDKIFFAGTFCKHPLAMAAAQAVLKHLKASGPALQQRLNERTAALAAELNRYFAAEHVAGRVIHFGSLFRFDFWKDVDTSDLLFYHLAEKGIYTWEGRNCALSTAHTDADLEHIVRAVKESIAELRAGGYFPIEASLSAVPYLAPSAPAPVPLTPAQYGIWTLAQLDPRVSASFNESIVCRFRGPLAVAPLRAALQHVVDRHEVLRTTFSADGTSQIVHLMVSVGIPLVDLTALPPERRETIAASWLNGELSEDLFDLVRGPLLRACLLRLSEHDHLLGLTLHHLIIDGWSAGVLLDEMKRLYIASLTGIPCRLSRPVPFREYVAWQIGEPQRAAAEVAQGYWVAQFADQIPLLELPADRPRPRAKSYRGARLSQPLAGDLTAALVNLSREQHCTPFMTLLAGFELLLHHLTGQDDLVVGITLAEQAALGERTLMGYCLKVLPLRCRLIGDPSFHDVLAAMRQRIADAQTHQAFDLGRLVKSLGRRRDPGRNPMYDVVFHHERAGVWEGPDGLRVEEKSNPSAAAAKDDLFWLVVEESGQLVVHCVYSTDLFTAPTIARWVGTYERLLRAASASPEASWSTLCRGLAAAEETECLLGDAEHRRVVFELNRTGVDFGASGCLHKLCEEQAARTPDAVAVLAGGEWLSFRQLDRR